MKFEDKTASGEYILERPPKKPGGLKYFCVLLFVCAAIEGANGQSADGSTPLASSDEEAFNPLMAVVSVLFVAILLLLLGFWDRRKTNEIKQRRRAKTKQAKRRKSAKIVGPASSGRTSNGRNESMDDPMLMSERETPGAADGRDFGSGYYAILS